jgi:hypothetical protein
MTQGFHPKPDFTYGPALALGMESRGEVLEFRSFFEIEERTFLSRINRALPSGIRFRKLKRLDQPSPSLSASISGFVYSLERPLGLPAAEIAGRLEDHLAGHGGERFAFRLKGKRLFLEFPFSSGRPPRPQDLVAAVFGLENSAFLLRRDGILGV